MTSATQTMTYLAAMSSVTETMTFVTETMTSSAGCLVTVGYHVSVSSARGSKLVVTISCIIRLAFAINDSILTQ